MRTARQIEIIMKKLISSLLLLIVVTVSGLAQSAKTPKFTAYPAAVEKGLNFELRASPHCPTMHFRWTPRREDSSRCRPA